VVPRGHARALVATGPYRLTRNPMYLGLALASAGVVLAAGGAWGYLGVMLAAAVVHVGVIRREEAHLEARFGEAYRQYVARVRRWV
jgi:protein-S-isoprenylcysteine O-methyltransferase Ste14